MAGIGFELKKIFGSSSISKKVWGYSCAAAIVSGPTFLVIFLLLILERIASGKNNADWNVLLAFITYSMISALIVSSVLTQVLARWSADALFQRRYDRIMPSVYGAFIVLIIPFGILYGLLLSTADKATFAEKAITWFMWAEMVMVYIEMGNLTAIKKYTNLMLWFLAGVVTALVCAWLLIKFSPFSLIINVETGLFAGYGVILCGYSGELHSAFPYGKGSVFRFMEYADRFRQLPFCGFFGISMSFVHIVIMWTSSIGEQVTGLFYRSPVYDSASFYAFLVAVPINILFVVSMETRFYEKFHSYFSAVSSTGTLRNIETAGNEMLKTLKNEILRLELVQLITLMAYMPLMRFFLARIGFTDTILVIFFFQCIGYAAQGLGASFVLLLLYFDDRNGALAVNIIGFTTTAVATLLLIDTPTYYGMGMTIGGITMAVAGILRMNSYVKDVDDHVFASQPLFAIERHNLFLKLIAKLDDKALNAKETVNK